MKTILSCSCPQLLCWLLGCSICFSSTGSLLAAEEISGTAQPGVLTLEDPLAPLVELTPRTEQQADRLRGAALFATGRLLEQRGEEPAALRNYERAYRTDRTATPALLDVIRLAVLSRRDDEAVRYALLGVERLASEPKLLRQLGLMLIQQGQWEQALKLYGPLLKDLPSEKENLESLTIRLEVSRLYFLTENFSAGSKIAAPLELALTNPEKFELTAAEQKQLLGEPALTFHLLGECHLGAGEFAAAKKCFEEAQRHQSNPGMRGYNLARVALKEGQPALGLEYLEGYFAGHLAGEGATPYETLVALLTAAGQADQIDARLVKLQQADPENVPLGLFLAERLLAANDLERAAALYQSLTKSVKKRGLEEVYRGLIAARLRLQQPETLLLALGEAASRLDSLSGLKSTLEPLTKDEKLRQQLYEVARQRRSTDAAQLPPAAESWAVAQIALAGGDLSEAQAFFEFALQDQPKRRGDLLEEFGVAMFMADHAAESSELFRRAAKDPELEKELASFEFYLAGSLALEDKTDEAIAAAERAAAVAPDTPRIVARKAWILYQAGRDEQAVEAYEDLMHKFGDQYDSPADREFLGEVRLTLSNLNVRLRNIPAGEEWLEKQLDEFPADTGALNDLGYLWADQGKRLERALEMIQQAVRAEPENRAFLDSLGWVQYRLGNYPEACEALERALEGLPEPDAVMLEHQGDVYEQLMQRGKARSRWQQALEALPEDDQKSEPQRQRLKEKLVIVP